MKKDTLSIIKWVSAFVALAVIVGCGGGGGGTSSTGSTSGGFANGTPPPGQYLEFFRTFTRVDPLNLAVGDAITVQFVNYDVVGRRTIITGAAWSLVNANGHATINSIGGLSITSDPQAFVTVTATANVAGQSKTLNQDIYVSPATGTHVKGKILANISSAAVPGVQAEFIDSGNNVVGAALTDSNGNFNGTVGNGANRIRLKAASVPLAYFAAIKYQGSNYAVVGNACLLSLPTLVPGGSVSFPSTIFLPRQQDGPPPPPTSCP